MQSRHVVLMECMDESLINGKQSITNETKKNEIVSETYQLFSSSIFTLTQEHVLFQNSLSCFIPVARLPISFFALLRLLLG